MIDKFKGVITEARWNELCVLVAKKKMKISFNDFTADEIRVIIDSSVLSENQKRGAIMYYVNKVRMNVIADRMNYSLATLKYHKKKVSRELRLTCNRVFK